MTLAERLGYGREAKLLIVNADDFGMCHAENMAITQLLQERAVSSATVMIPCSWAKEAVAWCVANPEYDVGVHLTFTSEWNGYKWGPVTRDGDVRTLVTEEGYFPEDVARFELQATRPQVRLEMINQVETALALGLAPTHLDNHMGSLYGLATGNHFLDVTFEICADYGLPFRLPRSLPQIGKLPPEANALMRQVTELADRMGVILLDDLIGLPFGKQPGETYESYKRDMIAVLKGLRPGVSEIIIHPALATEELKAIHHEWEKRHWDYMLLRDPDIKTVLAEEGIEMIRWKDLQDLQKSQQRL